MKLAVALIDGLSSVILEGLGGYGSFCVSSRVPDLKTEFIEKEQG